MYKLFIEINTKKTKMKQTFQRIGGWCEPISYAIVPFSMYFYGVLQLLDLFFKAGFLNPKVKFKNLNFEIQIFEVGTQNSFSRVLVFG